MSTGQDRHWYSDRGIQIYSGGSLERADKEWGSEKIICREPHAAKIMTLKPNYQVSMHWHKEKSETFILIEGQMIVELVNQKGTRNVIRLEQPYSSVTIDAMTPHTFYCPDGQKKDTVFIEASTKDHPDDSYRIYPSGPKGQGLDNWRPTD